jgi:hypothetical protein
MEMKFTVHNPHRTVIGQSVDYRGSPVTADLPCFEAELMSVDGLSGTLKVRVIGGDAIAEAEAIMVSDTVVTASFSGDAECVEAAKPEEANPEAVA